MVGQDWPHQKTVGNRSLVEPAGFGRLIEVRGLQTRLLFPTSVSINGGHAAFLHHIKISLPISILLLKVYVRRTKPYSVWVPDKVSFTRDLEFFC